MLHDIISAFAGNIGESLTFDGDSVQIPKLLLRTPMIHPSEFQILEDILGVVSMYRKITEFIRKHDTSPTTESAGPTGLYVSAVCKGMEEILQRYRTALLALEQETLEESYITMTHVRVAMEPFRSVFECLVFLAQKIEAQVKSSAVIVELVKSLYEANVPLQYDLKPLIPCVNKVLRDQIMSWVVFGNLSDPFDEFFIQCKAPSNKEEARSKSRRHRESQPHRSDSNKYFVNFSLVPAHFSVALVEKILFVGYAVGIVSNAEKTKAALGLKQNDLFEEMDKLSLDSFRTEGLEDAVGELANSVGKDLHHLVMTETDLPKYLGIIKDFYLTGRGELFHDFLLNLKEMETTLSKNSLITDVRQAFSLSASRLQIEEESLQRVQISVKNCPEKISLSSCIALMELQMDAEWPLHILFTDEVIKKYNDLFVFLLEVRSLQLDLHRCWMRTRKLFRFPIPNGPAELRNVMCYFIDHLQHYLQEDVLEHQFAILSDTVSKSDNFEQIRIAHATFHSNILHQSFRSTKLSSFVEKLMVVCRDFVRYMKQHIDICEKRNIPINEGANDDMLKFSQSFHNHMDLLLNLLKGIQRSNAQSGQHLSQFLLRLDFNSYFSSTILGLTDV